MKYLFTLLILTFSLSANSQIEVQDSIVKKLMIERAYSENNITPDQKESFFQHIIKHKEKYNLDDGLYNRIITWIKERDYKERGNILQFLPPIYVSSRVLRGILPDLTTPNNEFKDIFPRIHEDINEDFNPTNLRMNHDLPHVLDMDFNVKVISISTQKSFPNRLFKAINEHTEDSGFAIYYYYFMGSNYLYLDKEQKREIEEIFNFELKKM